MSEEKVPYLLDAYVVDDPGINVPKPALRANVHDEDRAFWLALRKILLESVDLIERYKLHTELRTADLRKRQKDARINTGT